MKEQNQKQWIDPDKDIVEHLIINKAVLLGDDGEVSVREDYIESRRYDRQAYINSFRGDVGILNILAKVGLEGARVQCGWQGSTEIVDISEMPDNIDKAYNIVRDAHALYASLPEALKGKMSYEEFINEFDQKAFDAYIESQTSKKEEGETK